MRFSAANIPSSSFERMMAVSDALARRQEEVLNECENLVNLEYDNFTSILGSPNLVRETSFNSFYGNSSVYRLLVNKPRSCLHFQIQHGLDSWSGNLHPAETDSSLPIVTSTILAADKFSLCDHSRPIIFAPPPLRILSYIRRSNPGLFAQPSSSADSSMSYGRKKYNSCAFFLSHSTSHVKEKHSISRIKDVIQQVRGFANNITVVLYYRDLALANELKPYCERVLCCGHFLDPVFLVRLEVILRTHSCISYNHLSSAAFHAASIGLPVFHFNTQVEYSPAHDGDQEIGLKEASEEMSKDRELFLRFLSPYSGQDISTILSILLVNNVSVEDLKRKLSPLFVGKTASALKHRLLSAWT